MSLKRFLRDQGYDQIDGPVRNHRLLQLWLKKGLNKIELYYSNITHAMKSDVVLDEFKLERLLFV